MGNTCPCFAGREQTGALRKNNPEEQTRPRENKCHASFKKYGLSVHSADSAAKQADSLHAAAGCIVFIHRQRHGRFGLLRQCDLRQVPFIYMPFIKIAADDVFLFKKMSF